MSSGWRAGSGEHPEVVMLVGAPVVHLRGAGVMPVESPCRALGPAPAIDVPEADDPLLRKIRSARRVPIETIVKMPIAIPPASMAIPMIAYIPIMTAAPPVRHPRARRCPQPAGPRGVRSRSGHGTTYRTSGRTGTGAAGAYRLPRSPPPGRFLSAGGLAPDRWPRRRPRPAAAPTPRRGQRWGFAGRREKQEAGLTPDRAGWAGQADGAPHIWPVIKREGCIRKNKGALPR